MFKPKDMFNAKKKGEQKEALSPEVKKKLQDTERLARDILTDARYSQMKKEMENLLQKAVNDLFKYHHQDNNVYAVNVRTILQQIKNLLFVINVPVNLLNYVTVQKLKSSDFEGGK